MHKKLRTEAEKTVFSSGLKRKTFELQSMVSLSLYLKDPASVLRNRILETIDQEIIRSSHERQNISHAINAKVGTKASPVPERFINCYNDVLTSWKITETDAI